jgi:hypothetical protein
VDSLSGVSPVTISTFKLVVLLGCFIALQAIALGQSIQSVYTDLDAKKCRTIKSSSDEGGSYEGRCPGVAGYSLIVMEGDVRQNIEVVTPKRTKHSLDLWSVVSGAFSSVGPKAEWRMKRVNGKLTPFALIVRYNASENPEDASKLTSYLAVAKITATSICVTDKIGPGANANELARRAADESATRPCLSQP